MGFQLVKMKQVEDYSPPFDHKIEGFNNSWWFDRCHKVADGDNTDYFKLLVDGAEVARAEITPWSLSNSYLRLSTKRNVYEIWFFEVREAYRDQGIGRRFAEMLADSYAPTEVIAFSKGADDFWSSIGWERCPRKDGDPHYRPLFVNKVW